MIDAKSKIKGDFLWIIDSEFNNMLKPKKVVFDSLESPNSTTLVFVDDGGKKICYPLGVLFDDETEAEMCGAIKFIKLYHSGELEFDATPDELLKKATDLTEQYETSHPDKFLYHWMNHVSEI